MDMKYYVTVLVEDDGIGGIKTTTTMKNGDISVSSLDFTNVCVGDLVITKHVEFYKDGLTGLLNREAFEQYAQKGIGRKGNKAVYLVKLKNYEYIKENCHETSLLKIIRDLGECLKEYTMLPSIYYLGVGRYVIIVHKKDKFVEGEFFEKLKERFDITFDLNGVNIHLNLFIAIMNMENGKINKNNFYKYFSFFYYFGTKMSKLHIPNI